MSDEKTWNEYDERGTPWFYRSCLWLYNMFGWYGTRWLIYPIVTFFFLTSVSRYRNLQKYFKRLISTEQDREILGHEPGWWDSYQLYLEFGKGIFNRVSLWLGHDDYYDIEFPNRSMLMDYIDNNQGVILLSSHVGHFDVMRYFALSKGVVVNVVAYWNNTEALNQLLESIDPSSQVNLITIDPGDPQGMVELRERIDNGEFVALLGDRVTLGPKDRYQDVPFLGERAPFPEGPFLLAHFLECPILLTHCVRIEAQTYKLMMEEFSEGVELPRSNRQAHLKDHMGRYASELEDLCRQYPYQWFNFHDFWSHPDEQK